jgi:hypothetical protein
MNEMKERAAIVTAHMSQTKVNCWNGDCQQKFAFIHIHEMKRPPAAYLSFGSGWDRFQTATEGFQDPYKNSPETHNGYYATKMKDGKDLPVSQAKDLAIEVLREELTEVEDWEGATQNELEGTILQAVPTFLKEEAPHIEPVELQKSLQVGLRDETGDWAVTGTLDFIGVDTRIGKAPAIRDLKTAKRRWPKGSAQAKLQPVHYSVLAQHNAKELGITDLDLDRFDFEILVKNKTPIIQIEHAHVDQAMRDSHLSLVSSVRSEVVEAANREYFRPNRGSWLCSQRLCPYHKECVKLHGGCVKE